MGLNAMRVVIRLIDILCRPAFLLLITLVVSVLVVGGALASEFWGGLVPCPLCLQQRWAYYAVIPTLGVSLMMVRWRPSVAMGLYMLVVLIFIASGILAFYHAGIEYGFWAGPVACSSGGSVAWNIEDLLRLLDGPTPPSCSENAWWLFGISLAGYNGLVSFSIVGYGSFALWRYWLKKPV